MRFMLILLLAPAIVWSQNPGKGHASSSINCKTCHTCEYPTVKNPCLAECPRADLITTSNSALSAPENIVLDRFKDRYGAVIFSHRLHAEMSDMGGGCESCHHNNTTGPVLACGSCHEPASESMVVGMPGLVAAYHRQCISCHREWLHTVDCQSCHALAQKESGTAGLLNDLKKKKHTRVAKPSKLVYETKTAEGSKATFFHDRHADDFGISCATCHSNAGCVSCHDINKKAMTSVAAGNSGKKTEAEKHAACFTCHENDKCTVCHSNTELKPFDHAVRTGWPIKKYHSNASCLSCHKKATRFEKVSRDCGFCHTLQKRGGFRHEITGLRFDDNHLGFACSDCHNGNRFDQPPSCDNCHDNKSWPKNSPGKRWP